MGPTACATNFGSMGLALWLPTLAFMAFQSCSPPFLVDWLGPGLLQTSWVSTVNTMRTTTLLPTSAVADASSHLDVAGSGWYWFVEDSTCFSEGKRMQDKVR